MTPTRKAQPIPESDAMQHALDYAKKIIQNYETDVKAGAWTGVNLEAAGFCQGEIYKEALATIDCIARGKLVV